VHGVVPSLFSAPHPPGLAAKLRNTAKGRTVDGPLLVKPTNRLRNDTSKKNATAPPLARWKKSDHTRPFARAVKAAGLDPDEVTIYALRHSSIVRQLLAGVPVRVVAVNHDTSVLMIERTYSRYIGDHADALARKALLDLSEAPSSNVVPISSAR
jgi:integrase